MENKRLNSLLAWGVDPTARPPDPEALAHLRGLIGAFDNLEMVGFACSTLVLT